jgi:hypothetical protein
MAVSSKGVSSARKEYWQEIQARLKVQGHAKSELKKFEAYYLTGKEPRWSEEEEAMETDPIPLVYRLWLHPDQSDESWCAITERVLAYKAGWLTGTSLKESSAILKQRANASMYNGVDAPMGFMGGAEKRIFQFMTGEAAPGNRYSYRGEPLYSVGWFGFLYYKNLCEWLNASVPSNPFQINHYCLNQWAAFVEGSTLLDMYLKDCKSDFRFEQYIKQYFSLIAKYPPPAERDENYERQEYCKEARDILNNTNIPPLLKGWWQEISAA